MVKQLYKLILRKAFWGFARHLLTDRQYARFRYWLEHDVYPDLKNPKRFTEKIQYLKLHERTALRKTLANRMAVRKYVENKAGQKHLIPLLGTFRHLTRETWTSLPNQFVLKANHGCGMIEIIRDKREANFEEIRRETSRWKETDYAAFGREWVYKNLPRTIVAEKLMLDASGDIPKDYKIFCFHGKAELVQIDFDRYGEQRRNLYDRNFNQLDMKLLYPHYNGPVQKPNKWSQAIELAETLSAGINFVRVDLYLLQDFIYFGEMTNFPGNGFVPFQPEQMEYQIGELLHLPQ